MAKPSALDIWASGLNYVNPAGPDVGTPTKIAIPAGVAADGHIAGVNPATATVAQIQNKWQYDVSNIGQWVLDGTFDPDQTAHVVETDAAGRASLHGLDVVNVVDEAALQVESSAEGVVAGVLIEHAAGLGSPGPLVRIDPDPSSPQSGLTIDHPGSGPAIFLTKTGAGTGSILRVEQTQAGVSEAVLIITNVAGSTALRVADVGGTASAAVFSTAGGAPLELTQQGFDPATMVNGQLWVHSTSRLGLSFRQGGLTKRTWATEEGLTTGSVYTAVTVILPLNTDSTVQTLNFTFRQNRWYTISVGVGLRSNIGGACAVRVEVNGVPAARFGAQQYDVPASAISFTRDISRTFRFQWAAADAAVNVTLHVDTQPAPLVTFAAGHRDITIVGAFDAA